MTITDPLADYRSRVELEKYEAAARRGERLSGQSAVTNSPGTRLRIWESLHALRLPLEADHSLLEVIVRDTGLTLEQVREEQRQRAAAAAASQPQTGQVWDPYCTRSGSGKPGA